MMVPFITAKIEILDRVAIIVDEGVVLESQVNSMMQNIKKDIQIKVLPCLQMKYSWSKFMNV